MSDAFDGVSVDRFTVIERVEPVVRLSLGIDLYFPLPMRQYQGQVLELWNRYLAWRGSSTMTWARLGGGNRSRKMTNAAYKTIAAWLDGSRSYGIHCFINVQNGVWEEIGNEGFRLDGNDRDVPPERYTSINWIELRLPLEVGEDPDELAKRFIELAEPLDFVCGTAGLKLHCCSFAMQDHWSEIRGLVTRYEGVDPGAVDRVSWRAWHGIEGVNWLTFVGEPHLSTLGGAKAVLARAAKANDVTAQAVGKGVVLRAGHAPRIGDRNHPSTDLDPYRNVFDIVEPAMFFDPAYAFDDPYFDGDQTVAWLRRFARDDG